MKTLIYLLIVFTMLAGVPAFAQTDTVTDDDVNRVARQLYCPQCENITLDVCGTAACVAWRKEIRVKLVEGWTDQEIFDYFVEQYGQRVLPQPNDPLISFLLVVVPAAAIVAGAAFVMMQLRKGQPEASAPPVSSLVEIDDDYRARLERELQERLSEES